MFKKDFYKGEILILVLIFFSLLSLISPILSLGQTQAESSSNQVGNETLASIDSLSSSDFESTTKSIRNEPTVDSAVLDPGTSQSNEKKIVNDTQNEETTQELRASSQDILNSIVVSDWELYRDKGSGKESLTVEPKSSAEPNQAYDFNFSWTIAAEKLGRNILPGDYFVLAIPQNENQDTGHWYAVLGEWQTMTTNDGNDAIYRYRVENSADGKTQVIRVEFLEDVDKLHITTLDSDLTFAGFMNYVTKESVQNVAFGRDTNGTTISKQITFHSIALNAANGFSFKYGSAGSNNSLKWTIQFNGAANVELGGDQVDYNVNGGVGNKYQGFYTDKPGRDVWLPWGSNYTDIFAPPENEGDEEYGGYVEDDLPAGAELTTLTIAGYIPIPIGLNQENYTKQEGVYPSTTAAFQSFVLADYGNGPTYRAASDTGETQKPKSGTGFKLLTQGASETKGQFKERIKAVPYQYGVYKDSSGISTVMMHYGSMKKATNQQQKLSELTDSAYTGRTITNPKTGVNTAVTQFAAQAADYSIRRGYYAEEDRELLENYYSITFGDSNVIGGKIAAYNISLTVRYPPNTPSGSIKNESAIYTHSALTLNRKEPEPMPKRDSATATLKNPYGSISLNADQALLQKFDVERDENDEYVPINGAKFKLQLKDGDKWTDVKKNNEVLIFETDGLQYFEVENGITVEKTVNGLVKVDFNALGLTNGMYRFVETQAAAGYDEEESPNWDGAAVVSDTFTIPSATSRGPTVTVWNKKLPQAKYTVEHYVQKSEGNTAKENFELRQTEEKSGYLGQVVSGEPLMELLRSYDYDEALSMNYGKITGTVTVDGELKLQLYYTIAAEVPFTLYKQGMNGEMMPSVDSSGNPLYDEQGRETKAAFDVYEWNGDWDNSNPYNNGNGPKGKPEVWTKVNAQPIMTDALGRIRVPEITDLTKYYAIVEVETYPDYVLPYNSPPSDLSTYREVYWVVRMSDSLIFSAPSWAHGTEVDKPEFEAPSVANGNRYILKNRKPEISLFKVNEQDEAMPSTDKQKVQFDIYRWNSGGYFDESTPYTWNQWTKIASNATTDNQGRFAKIGQTGLDGGEDKNYDWYLIRETSTYSGYQKAEGHWLVKTAWNVTTQKFEIFEVKYKIIQGMAIVDGEDPGHKISDSKTALYLTNKAKAISFTKEDEKQQPLVGVHFSLYQPKAGESGSTGSEEPTASDTKWDMENPIEKISSTNASETGKVTFDALPRGEYLLMETNTLPGYQLPLGYWIVTVDFYGEIETIRGRGDPLPPAFRVADGKYFLPNYLTNSLPNAGGYMRVFLIILGIVLLGFGGIILQNKKMTAKEKGKEDEKEIK